MLLNNDAVSHMLFTPVALMTALSPDAVGSCRSGKRTHFPPFNKGAQISSVDASKPKGARERKTRLGSSRMKFGLSIRRTIARCGTTTPLGSPVEPDVNMM